MAWISKPAISHALYSKQQQHVEQWCQSLVDATAGHQPEVVTSSYIWLSPNKKRRVGGHENWFVCRLKESMIVKNIKISKSIFKVGFGSLKVTSIWLFALFTYFPTQITIIFISYVLSWLILFPNWLVLMSFLIFFLPCVEFFVQLLKFFKKSYFTLICKIDLIIIFTTWFAGTVL